MSETPDTGSSVSELSETEAALKRLLGSERFRKNASLRNLLEYLVARTLNGEGEGIKETTVAMDVFGRSEDFDSRIDNIVRVQAHRLRKLLTAYYEAEGAAEPIRFTLPKGGYLPRIEGAKQAGPIEISAPVASAAFPPVELPATPTPFQQPRRISPVVAFAAGVLAAGLVFWGFTWSRSKATGAANPLPAGSALAALWGPLLRSRLECVVSYSNPVFLGIANPPAPRILIPYRGPLSAPTGARLQLSGADLGLPESIAGPNSSFVYTDSWTGVGEVVAIQHLTALIAPKVPMRILRSRAVTYADLQGNNLVFLGSPWANDMQSKINIGQTPLMNDNEGNIRNLQPQSGEPAAFRAQVDGATGQITSTYALFSVLPGVTAGTRVYISAGVNTFGTGSAMAFLTSEAGAEELSRRFAAAGKPNLPDYFQVVLRSEVIRGEPADTHIVLVHALGQTGRSTVR
jgi:hypothetical protein